MKDVLIGEQISVSLKAAEWYWLLGLLAAMTSQENATLDRLYAQVMEATQ